MRRIAVIGSRDFNDLAQVIEFIGTLPLDTEIVSGGARGVDSAAEGAAVKRGLKVTVFKPEYKLYGKRAPLERNKQIMHNCDEAVAFWDASSAGTNQAVTYGRSIGKVVDVRYSRKEWMVES